MEKLRHRLKCAPVAGVFRMKPHEEARERVPAVQLVKPLLNDVDGTAIFIESGHKLTAHAELLRCFRNRLGREVHVRTGRDTRGEILEEGKL